MALFGGVALGIQVSVGLSIINLSGGPILPGGVHWRDGVGQ